MNRNFYSLAIFITALYLLVAAVQAVLYIQHGGIMYNQQSASAWYIFGVIIYLSASGFLLKYFHHKQYRFVFFGLIISTVTFACHSIIIYFLWVAGELGSYNNISTFILYGTGILYALSLIFSITKQRPWLRTAGVFVLIHQTILLWVLISLITPKDPDEYAALDKIQRWASLPGALVPLLLIMNFRSEWKHSSEEESTISLNRSFEGLILLAGLIALGYGAVVAKKLTKETYAAAAWKERTAQRAEGLAGPFEARVFVNNSGDSLLYRIMKPLNYDPGKKYPLVVCLHGGHGVGTDNVKQIDGSPSAQYLSNDDSRRNYPAFLFVPQCPPGFNFGGYPRYAAIDSLVFETIHEVEKEFSIDTTRRYIIGESLGGVGTWHFIATRPEMFAAAIPVCGMGDPQLGAKMVDVAVWAFHGRKDRGIPVRGSADMIAAIKKAGGNPRYTEYPEEGHIIAYLVYETEGLWEWMFAQRK